MIIHAFVVYPGTDEADSTCFPFKAGDEAGQQAAFDSAKEKLAENAENLELDGEARIELVVVEPDECADCQCEDDDCDCRQSSNNPEWKPKAQEDAPCQPK